MTRWQLPSGRHQGIPFILPNDWSPAQAQAVAELLDDLRELIYAHYQIPIQELLAEERGSLTAENLVNDDFDPPF